MQPITLRERIGTLDVLRGFAMAGVLVANLHLYSGRYAVHEAPSGLDVVALWFMAVFVAGRAQSLLTLLFGFGFAIQLLRAAERGEPVLGVYFRRLVVLFALGGMHVLLLWFGDVTWGYAVAGLALLPFRNASNRTRLIWAASFILIPPVIDQLPGVAGYFANLVFGDHSFQRLSGSEIAAMHGHDRFALAIANAKLGVMWTIMDFGYPLWLVGHFLIGYVVGILRWFDRDGVEHLALFRRLLIWGAPIALCGIAWNIVRALADFAVPMPVGMVVAALEQVTLLAQVGVYVAAVVLLMQRVRWRRLLMIVAPVGRMPLTTYFSQSVICTFLLYAWGLHWAMPRPWQEIELATVVFAGQITIAHVWLRYFNFGPLEWVWRTLVYLRPPAMRRRANVVGT
jgi:uncharacterized protein